MAKTKRKNEKVEEIGTRYLLSEDPCVFVPTKEQRKTAIELHKINPRYRQSFDVLKMNKPVRNSAIVQLTKTNFKFIEIKSTDTELEKFPEGFFFGLTDNQEKFAKKFEKYHRYCFVCINPATKKYTYMTQTQMRSMRQHRRVQYQINFLKTNS